MHSPIVLVDVDGVLADWYGEVAKLTAKHINLTFIPTAEEYPDIEGFWPSVDKMWEVIDYYGIDFWRGLKKLPDAHAIWDLAKKYGTPLICTSPSKNPVCAAGKMMWLKAFFNNDGFRNHIITPRKYACADPMTFLIDDHPRQNREFQQYGGYSYCWPQPWNDTEVRPGWTNLQELESALEAWKATWDYDLRMNGVDQDCPPAVKQLCLGLHREKLAAVQDADNEREARKHFEQLAAGFNADYTKALQMREALVAAVTDVYEEINSHATFNADYDSSAGTSDWAARLYKALEEHA